MTATRRLAAILGDHTGSPKIVTEAEVHAIPINEYSTIATGKPNA